VQFHAHGRGDGPAVVLVHGAPDRSTAFGRALDELDDLRVAVYDRRGYGESVAMAPAATLGAHADDLIDILAAFAGGPAVVVGHSFGGNVAMYAAVRRPDLVAAVGTWETSMCWLAGWPADHTALVRDLAETPDARALGEQMGRSLLGARGWERLDEPGRELRRAEGLAFALDMRFLLDAPYDVRAVRAPIVHGLGGDSVGAHVVGARCFADAIGVEPVLIPGTSHLVHTQAPSAWAAFVRRVVATAAG
jgi:pimeloyl-ACP methyl ester carboxylesterase